MMQLLLLVLDGFAVGLQRGLQLTKTLMYIGFSDYPTSSRDFCRILPLLPSDLLLRGPE